MNKHKEEVKSLMLADLWDLCYRAHSFVSFSPDRRATQLVTQYSEVLEADLESLGDNQGNYKDKFIAYFKKWMGAKGNCASSMITGPSGFNVRRAEKANNREHARYMDFMNWREKYFKAVNREKWKSPEEELELAMVKHDELVIRQENMKAINKHIRIAIKDEITIADTRQRLVDAEYSDEIIAEAMDKKFSNYGFPSYMLTNNNAKIKSAKEKIDTMRARIVDKATFQDIHFEGGYITIEDDRVKVFHDEKPSDEIRQELKSNGFRYSPHWVCWCRKHTANAIQVAKSLSFV